MYIKPDKYIDLKTCVIQISADIINFFLHKKNKKIKYSNFHNHFFKIYGEEYFYIISPALNFLYLLGKIEYKESTDELELII